MAGVYLFAAVADDARPRSERMSNMAMIVKKWTGTLIIALVMLVSSGCRTPVIPDGVYMADVGESKITMVGNEAELDLLLDPEKKKRYVALGTVVNGSGTCPDGISGQPIYFITTSTHFSPFEIYELGWFYDGQNILAVYPDKTIVTFTLNQAVGPGTATERSNP